MIAHEVQTLDEEATGLPDGTVIAHIDPATDSEVVFTLGLAISNDLDDDRCRSRWVWVRLINGDLCLATYPQGDAYEQITQTMLKGRI